MLNMIKVELTKLRKRKMTWILLVVLAAFFCIMVFATYGITESPPDRMPEGSVEAMRSALQFPDATDMIFSTSKQIGTLLLIILVASGVGNEYGWGSVRQVLTRRGARHHYVIAKLVAFIIAALVGLVISLIIGFVLVLITSNLIGSINWDFITASYVGGFFRMFGWTLFSLLPYILLAFFFAFLGRSALAGIGGGLGFYFVEAIAVGLLSNASGWLSKIPHYLIGPNADALVPSIEMQAGPFGSSGDAPSTLWAAMAVLIYSVALLGLSLWMFKKRDITA
jgi:ABC-2 type transport system permease protein